MYDYRVGDRIRHVNDAAFKSRGVLTVRRINQRDGHIWIEYTSHGTYAVGNVKAQYIRHLWPSDIQPSFAAKFGSTPDKAKRLLAMDMEITDWAKQAMTASEVAALHKELSSLGIGPTGRQADIYRPENYHYIPKLEDPSVNPNTSFPPPGQLISAAEMLAQAEAQVVAAQAALTAENERLARAARLNYEKELARATTVLLNQISDKAYGPRAELAKYRKELQALALTYGVKIVLVGDRSTAQLVEVA